MDFLFTEKEIDAENKFLSDLRELEAEFFMRNELFDVPYQYYQEHIMTSIVVSLTALL